MRLGSGIRELERRASAELLQFRREEAGVAPREGFEAVFNPSALGLVEIGVEFAFRGVFPDFFEVN